MPSAVADFPANAHPLAVATEPTGAGELVSARFINTTLARDVAAVLASVGPGYLSSLVARYDVASYRIEYLTTDGQGKPITASGLICVPIKRLGRASPLVSYQHGTTFRDAEAPSNNAVASEPAPVMAALGAIVVAADYVGYGASKGALAVRIQGVLRHLCIVATANNHAGRVRATVNHL